MANRCTIHRSKIKSLESWLVARSWHIDRLHTMPPYQILRAWKQRVGETKRWFIVFDRDGCDHLSVRQSDIGLIQSFISDCRTVRKKLAETVASNPVKEYIQDVRNINQKGLHEHQ